MKLKVITKDTVRNLPARNFSSKPSTFNKKKKKLADVFEKQVEVIHAGIKEANYIVEKGLSIAKRGIVIAKKMQKVAEDEVFNELLKIDVPGHEVLDAS